MDHVVSAPELSADLAPQVLWVHAQPRRCRGWHRRGVVAMGRQSFAHEEIVQEPAQCDTATCGASMTHAAAELPRELRAGPKIGKSPPRTQLNNMAGSHLTTLSIAVHREAGQSFDDCAHCAPWRLG